MTTSRKVVAHAATRSTILASILALGLGGAARGADSNCRSDRSNGMCKLVTVLQTIESRHADVKVADKLVTKMMDHLAKEHDPYANYYDVEAYRELRRNLDGRRTEGVSMSQRLLPGKRAYVRIHHFDESVPYQLTEAIRTLSAESGTQLAGAVLDLRDNPGGLVRVAVAVAAAFLPRNALVITTRGDGLEAVQEFRAHPGDYLDIAEDDPLADLPAALRKLPPTVLVNRGSASASEILAAALQDHHRATIIGTRTYGKGTVQTIIPLADETAIKFTTSFFYTPNGRKVDGQGVTPDLVIKRKAPEDKASANVGRATAAPALPSSCVLTGVTESLAEVKKLSGEDLSDCQLLQAVVALSTAQVVAGR